MSIRNQTFILGQNETDPADIEDEPVFDGIDDPLTCIELSEAVLFQISNTSYPVYDRDNLWNTNPDFDYGLFQSLNESQQLTGESRLFAFRFTVSGVFAFYLSNEPDRTIVIRVAEEETQCPDAGPFFPSSPSQAVQLGIVRSDDILQVGRVGWLIYTSNHPTSGCDALS